MDVIDHEEEDPFLWDVSTVSTNLCSPGRPWARDPDGLTRNINEEEIDGRTLLTYEHTFSRKELMKCLGVKTARQMAALAEEIIGLQSRSKGFRAWKRNYLKKISLHDLLDDEPQGGDIILGTSLEPPDRSDKVHSTSAFSGDIVIRDGRLKDQTSEQPPPTPAESNSVLASDPSGEEQNGVNGVRDLENLAQTDGNRIPGIDVSHAIPSSLPPSDHENGQDFNERPLKRRRVEPINLNLQPLADHTIAAPGFRIPDPSREAANEINEDAYLGGNMLNEFAVKSSIGPADPRIIEFPDSAFATAASIFIPPGQRIWVAGLMKILLKKNGRRESLLKQGRAPSTHSTGDEEILDMSDIAEEWDEETKREIEEEKAEDAARDRELARCLSQERVEAILQEALQIMKTKWEEKKLPRYQKKAYGLWIDAARRGRTMKIINAQQGANHCEFRIQNIITEILKDKWQREQDVRDQAKILEQNVDEKLYSLWLVNLLESRVQPEKPVKVPRPRELKPRPSLLDDEVLTSDDDMDDFVVHDDNEEEEEEDEDRDQTMNENVANFEESPPRTPAGDVDEDMVLLDLTQIDTPEQASDSRAIAELIDLTTPQKTEVVTPSKQKQSHQLTTSEILESQPLIDQLENVESIARLAAIHWTKQKDRWRLIISMIYRLGHSRRQSIFGLLRDNSTEDVWDASIQLQLTNPIKDISQLSEAEAEAGRLLAFDITRVFYSFLRCRQIRDAQIADLDKKARVRLKSSKDALFPTFCSFLKEMAPHFPQDSQVLRADAFDDIEVDGFSDEGPSYGHRRAVREVVQNKEALDMREREARRIEEQEARRIKLRAEMAKSTVIPSDKSRLIINESKQDDQDFIYVNEEIGNLIKDHQINGVRFLWNQLIRDANVRQGCLLAHTMGLGKTMQVITFLVAIVEAAASEETSVRDQIPDDLRKSQAIVLCPAGLVDNWEDEVLRWAPKGLLGSIWKVESTKSQPERHATVRDWAKEGGLLIIGYDMFKRICGADESDIGDLMLDTPNLVIADEAHMLKNPNSKVHQICAKFRTGSRIALTGTPLANNVEEYYFMISWVAPNFLGPHKEFREIYANPIQQGLWSDSGRAEKREAMKMMEVLKRTVAPKVNRATISAIENDLPRKHEFVLFVAPTPMQRKLYDLCMAATLQSDVVQARIFAILNDLTLICNHPRCYHAKAQGDRQSSTENDESPVMEHIRTAILKETNKQDLNDPRLSQKVMLLMLILDEARIANEKVLVFSQSIPTLDYLENLFQMQKRRVSRLDGMTKISTRQESIKSFNQGDKEVYLISTRAGGVGLNIQGANRVVIFDIKWNPVVDQQAIGRAYRIGQEKRVFVYHFLMAGSFEEKMHKQSVFKTQLASRAVDSKFPISWGERSRLLEPLKPVPSCDLNPFLNQDTILDKLIGHKLNGEGIQQILSTDTFEEEDATSKVPPDLTASIEEFLKMDQMRRHDPENYERLLVQKQMADLAPYYMGSNVRQQGGAGRPPNTGNHQSSFSHVNQSMDGASDFRDSPTQLPRANVVSSAQVAPSSQHIPVPPPIAGANTFFREAESIPAVVPSSIPSVVPSSTPSAGPPTLSPVVRSAIRSAVQPAATSAIPPPTPSAVPLAGRIPGLRFEPRDVRPIPVPKGGIFGPLQSQAKEEFEKKLFEMLQKAQGSTIAKFAEELGNTAKSITMDISICLRKEALGFLHDDARWGLLNKNLNNDRFFSAIISGILRPSYLALAQTDELERRISLLISLSDQDLRDQYKRRSAPDPSNLGNIRRPSVSSVHAIEDLKVMRLTADKRKQRGIRLPSWANEALAQNGSESPEKR